MKTKQALLLAIEAQNELIQKLKAEIQSLKEIPDLETTLAELARTSPITLQKDDYTPEVVLDYLAPQPILSSKQIDNLINRGRIPTTSFKERVGKPASAEVQEEPQPVSVEEAHQDYLVKRWEEYKAGKIPLYAVYRPGCPEKPEGYTQAPEQNVVTAGMLFYSHLLEAWVEVTSSMVGKSVAEMNEYVLLKERGLS